MINKRKYRRFRTVLPVFCLVCLLLAGCGRYSETVESLEEYRVTMENFYQKIENLDERIRGIDAQDEASEQEFLNIIDNMTSVISDASVAEPPEQLSDAKTLLLNAAGQMKSAKKLYHEAFEEESFDSEAFSEAEKSLESCSQTLLQLSEYLQSIADDH